MMNFPGVAMNDPKTLGEIAATQVAEKTMGGHFASPDLELMLYGHVAGGPADDHEGTRKETPSPGCARECARCRGWNRPSRLLKKCH
jgi:adenine deaminase